MQIELQILTEQIQRHAAVVEERASIAQFQAAYAQAEQGVAPVAIARGPFERRDVALAVRFDSDEYLRPINDQFIEIDAAAEKGNNVQGHVHPIRVKQGRRVRRFKSVKREALNHGGELPDLQMEGIHFDARAGSLLNLLYDGGANPLLREICSKKKTPAAPAASNTSRAAAIQK